MTKLVRMGVDTYEKLTQLSKKSGISKQRVLDMALERYKRDQIMDEANRAYEAIKKDPAAWKEELDERALWDIALADGLDDE